MFSDEYNKVYNSVPYGRAEKRRIESEVLSRVQRSSVNSYCITFQDIMNVVTHLKLCKSNE